MNGNSKGCCGQPQCFVDQAPKFENRQSKKVVRPNQVVGKTGIIRPDKRRKKKYL